jgi:cellulose synthase/poly-beta-1,6-N-acetylglucosamine synthase-like glycosyltransferase
MLFFILNVIFALLAIAVIYVWFFSTASLLYKDPVLKTTRQKNSFVVYIPAYREDAVILSTVKNVLEQPTKFVDFSYDVIVIAQHLKKETVEKLKKIDRCKVLEFNVDKSTKVKALQAAIAEFNPNGQVYSHSIILDADNHIERNFIHKINKAFQNGYTAIQAHRKAKNKNTKFAYLDAISEEMNNSIFRKGFNVCGFSASIIGSGICVESKIFNETINESKAISGFDKEMENVLSSKGIFIKYLETAHLYDEKVETQAVFEKQRTRWTEAQIRIAKQFVVPGFKALIKDGNVDFFMKSSQNIMPPRIMLLGLVSLFTFISMFVNWHFFTMFFGIFITYVLALFISIPKELWTKDLLYAIIKVPNALFSMVKGVFKIGQSKKQFIHTPHSNVNS